MQSGTASQSSSFFSFFRIASLNREAAAPVSDSDLRKSRTDDIVRHAGDLDEGDEWGEADSCGMANVEPMSVVSESVPLVLRLLGILPVCRGGPYSRINLLVHQGCVLLLVVLSLVACLEQTVTTRTKAGEIQGLTGSMCYGEACLRLGLLADLTLATGSVIGYAVVIKWSKRMLDCAHVLAMYTQRIGYAEIWQKKVRQDLILTFLLWLGAVFERTRGSLILDDVTFAPGWIHIAAFSVSSSVLMGLAFVVLYICSALTTIVDAFCISYDKHQDLEQAVQDWNAVQAVIRKCSSAVEFCFFVLQTTSLTTVLLGAFDGINPNSRIDLLIPTAFLTLGIGRIFFRAGAVTDKCSRTPSLINSFGEGIDEELQYVVQYLIHSDAGFHVFEVRLTSPMAFKFVYLCGAAAFIMVTRVYS
jgi:hypothetical protein